MSIVHIMGKDKESLHEYKKALKMAKKAIETLCEISEEMEYSYDERGYKEDFDEYEHDSRRPFGRRYPR